MTEVALSSLLKANSRYNEDLKKYLSGTLDNQKIFNLGNHFGILSQYLDSSSNLYMRQGILSKAAKGHDTSIDLKKMESLPQKLAHPAQIFKSKKPGSIVAVLSSITDSKRQLVVVAIEMHHKRFIGQTPDKVNVITSIHGRPLRQLLKWREDGLELYYNGKSIKTNSTHSNQPGAIPDRELSGVLNNTTNVLQNIEPAKSLAEKMADLTKKNAAMLRKSSNNNQHKNKGK
jgi:hypothetical protein